MKKLMLIAILIITSFALLAQGKTHKVNQSSGTLVLLNIDEVTVEGYAGTEIIMTNLDFNEAENKRAAGLRMINTNGLTDNTGIGLSVVKEGDRLIVSQVSARGDGEYKIQLPHKMNLEYEHGDNSGGDIDVHKVTGEIVISTTYGDVGLHDVTGPMSIKSIYGSVEVKFGSLEQQGSVSIESVYDLVDVTIPKGAKADVKLSTPYGEIYSNADITIAESDGMRKHTNHGMNGKINGGGVHLYLKASYDNIYLREQ